MRLAYLYSRYPVLSQTFCDTEMLELERRGVPLFIGAIHSPLTSIRHGHTAELSSPVCYAPPQPVLRVWEENAKTGGTWPAELIAEHDRKYGAQFKAATRARNALYFADLFARNGIDRFHVHFANRAAHTALFVKKISGIPFSITAHGQDFMADLGSDELLHEICLEAEFVAVETEYSRGLLARKYPDLAGKIHRVFNGMQLSNFPAGSEQRKSEGPLRIVSVGRLVEFKGFNYLVAACADLRLRETPFCCEIIGDGPLRVSLQQQITELQLDGDVSLAGALSQEEVRDRLRDCDVFALASILDNAETSDVFPTVILEAMASAKPVVSTVLAGIPESVVHEQTGLLVPPRDSAALANALQRLAANAELRNTFGQAGRRRIEEYFQVAKTVEPLLGLLERVPAKPVTSISPDGNGVAYLIDRWPDRSLPHLETELLALRQHGISPIVFACEYDSAIRLTDRAKSLIAEFTFLPDEMIIEAEWQLHRATVHRLENDRANAAHRAPPSLFLRAARHAVALHRQLMRHGVTHVHATSARALVCASMLRALTGVTISATVPRDDESLPREFLGDCLQDCIGGRLGDPKRLAGLTGSWMRDPASATGVAGRISAVATRKLAGSRDMWEQWASLLRHWSQLPEAQN